MARRAFTLIAVLLILVILMTLGLGLMSKRAAQYSSAPIAQNAAQALAIAQAGIEDARAKLSKDLDFPPAAAVQQTTFSYVENLYDVDGVTSVGSYQITVDTSLKKPSTSIIQVQSIGVLGPSDAPIARRRLHAEFDVSPTDRAGSSNPNSNLYQIVQFQDLGAY